MLKEIKVILDREKIPFWLEAGTLLGAIRENRILPWDTDIDLGGLKKDFPDRIKKRLTKEFEKKGFIVYFFPEKIDFVKDENPAIQIHLAYGPKKGYFTRQMADNREKSGKLLHQVYRLSNVSYYGRFKLNASRGSIKTNLFKIITFFPKNFKKKISDFVMAKLTNLKDAGIYYINVPESYFSNLKKINFYGSLFYVPSSCEKYLEAQYGDWRTPPKEKGPWVWHEHGNWKKVYKKEEMLI